MNKNATRATVVTAALLAVMTVAPNSFAAVAKPMACPPDVSTTVTNARGAFVGDKSKTVYGDSGVTLSLSVAKGHTWTGTFTYSGTFEESAIIASAKETVGGSISYAKTTTVTLSGSWKVPASQRSGWLALGSQGYTMNWKTTRTRGNCQGEETIGHGTAKLPAKSPYIKHS